MKFLCDEPGGCCKSCRKAIARGDDMEKFWPGPQFEIDENDITYKIVMSSKSTENTKNK